MLNKLSKDLNVLINKRRCFYLITGIFLTILIFQNEYISNHSTNLIREVYKKLRGKKSEYSTYYNVTESKIPNQILAGSDIPLLTNVTHDKTKNIVTKSKIPNQILARSEIPLLTNVTHDKTKNIILWTAFHSDITWEIKELGRTPFKNCEYTSCHISNNKTNFSNADALLFHERDIINFQYPLNHPNNQIWIFFNLESPVHTYGDLISYDYIFNWTATYTPQSDIYNPYDITVMKIKSKDNNTENHKNYSNGKLKLAIIVVSNCNTKNHRLVYRKETIGVRSLEVQGACSNNFPNSTRICYSKEEPTEICMERYLSRYKFYLAFENSNCVHYITEKFFRALSMGTIPVVFGARYSDYVRIAPPFSFIFVASPLAIAAGVMGNQSQNSIPNNLEIPKNHPYFHSNNTKELAKYLLKLDSNDTLYNEYHAWREEYILEGKRDRYLCSICEHLHLKDIPNKSHKISDWWNREKNCKE
ncbi:glycoprotein 3-alpha-L-fucosyltransferase A-like [Gordionus sp. m RMFG-2023]|uniref:glycoprotein 3-alpha-L-fucosyltransferase A-like n=1 Tax=Gordionus sp. m RMFG-2023 TaxID=3053472 RepID=UPI0031FD82ED